MVHDLGPGLGVTVHRYAPHIRRVGAATSLLFAHIALTAIPTLA